MKTILILAASLMAFSAHASVFSTKLNCTVTEVHGSMGSFLPPVVGDKVTIDPAPNQIAQLDFSNRHGVMLQNPLLRADGPATPDYLTTFQSVQDSSDMEVLTTTLMVGGFWDGTKTVYAGEIQLVAVDGASKMTAVDDLKLSCEPVK